MTADQIEREIRGVLDSFGNDFWNEKWGERTLRVKNEIGSIGNGKYSIYASACDFSRNGEWLFDMTWLVLDNDGFILDVPLILESEWLPSDEIGNDFQKLMVGRAGLRVMIFSVPGGQKATTEFENLRKAVGLFSAGQPSDRYLLAASCEEFGAFEYCSFCAGDLNS
jgi:hypothetical protein